MSELETNHVEAAVQRMANLHAEYAKDTSPLQRHMAGLTAALARPLVVVAAMAGIIAWTGYNLASGAGHFQPFDPAPFPLLQTLASVFALFTTLLILATQRKEEELARRRAQLTLQLASLSEQKVAKVI